MMKTRFRKVWCHTCSTMQFHLECPHDQGPTGPRPARALRHNDTFGLLQAGRLKFTLDELALAIFPPKDEP